MGVRVEVGVRVGRGVRAGTGLWVGVGDRVMGIRVGIGGGVGDPPGGGGNVSAVTGGRQADSTPRRQITAPNL
jgi:hypothetical protein